MSFDKESANCIEQAQEYFSNENVKNDLLYIKSHFKFLIDSIKRLETFGLPLTEKLDIEQLYKDFVLTHDRITYDYTQKWPASLIYTRHP